MTMTKAILDTTSHPLFLFTPSPKHWILKSLQAATPIVNLSSWCLAVLLVFGSLVGVWQSCWCLAVLLVFGSLVGWMSLIAIFAVLTSQTPDIQHSPPSTSAFSTFHHLFQHSPLSIIYFSIFHFPSSTSAFSTFHHLLQHFPLSIIYFSIVHFPSSTSAFSTFHHPLQHLHHKAL